MTVHHFGAIKIDTENPDQSNAEYLRILLSRTKDADEAARLRGILSDITATLDLRHKNNIGT